MGSSTAQGGAEVTARVDAARSFQETHAFRLLECFVLLAAAVSILLGTWDRSGADPANSRLATVYSLTEHGTFYIDRPLDEPPNPFEQRTIDKVMVKDRLISSKPPMFSLLMTAEFIVMRALFGWDLLDGDDLRWILYVMTVTLVGGGYLATLIFLLKTLGLFGVLPLPRLVLLTGLAFGTQYWGFSTILNNHAVSAGFMMAALYLATGLATGKLAPAPWRFAAFGLTGAMVPTIDLPATVLVFLAGLALLARFPRQTLVWVSAGAFLPIAIHVGIMSAVTGHFVPVQTRSDTYHFQSSFWRHPRGIDALNEPKGTYLFNMLAGRKGIFLLFPILLPGVAGCVRALLSRDMPGRHAVLLGGLGVLIMVTYYATSTNNYGGECYGFRWLMAAMPVLLLMGAPVLQTMRVRWKWIAVGMLLALSFYSGWESSKTGWRANQEWTCRFLDYSYH